MFMDDFYAFDIGIWFVICHLSFVFWLTDCKCHSSLKFLWAFDIFFIWKKIKLEHKTWEKLEPNPTGLKPPPRARHSAVAIGKKIYIFGGVQIEVFCNDFFVVDTGNNY